ncbi:MULTISPECIES: cation:proton antiporter [Pedobacter]|uniref:cation:proton antiporter n=1 Tax=Pedobacter TaxID=84567 RepID=UPI00210E69F7|nr:MULTISPECIES: cation:proton antiporter [unclassified Pedobacter]
MLILSSLEFTLPLTNPVIIFSLVLFIILFAPILFNKIRIPHIIGLILAGTLVGPYGLNLLRRDSSILLFGTVGLLYIMFLAGLEIDLGEFKKNKGKILVFGLTTFLIPLGLGSLASYYVLNFDFMASLLLASMFSTHTLIAYPIASKYGIVQNRAVTMTVGGTMITDVLALLILAGVAGSSKGDVSSLFWIRLGVSSFVFVGIVLFVFPIIIRWFFKKFDDSVSQYIFVLGMVFLAAFMAEAAGMESIIGAFFSGLVLNKFVPHTSPLMNRIDFVGNALFIPFFLISVGMLVDVSVLFKGWGAMKVAGVIIVVSLASKYLAAVITAKAFKLRPVEGNLIFGLSSSHAAATLAIILVGYNIITGETPAGEPIRLLNEDVLNGTILLILVSCAVSSFVVERAARTLALEDPAEPVTGPDQRVLVSLSHPELMADLLDLGFMLRQKALTSPLYALNVIDDKQLPRISKAQIRILDRALVHAAAVEQQLIPISRHDASVSNGIVYTAREHQISDLVVGLHKNANATEFFGQTVESTVRRFHDTIYVYKAVQPLNTLKRLIVLAPQNAESEPGFSHWVQRSLVLAGEAGMSILFYGSKHTLAAIKSVLAKQKSAANAAYHEFNNWEDFLILGKTVKANDLMVIVAARKLTASYLPQMQKLPHYLSRYFEQNSFIILYPKQLPTGIDLEDIQQSDGSLLEPIAQSKLMGAIKRLFSQK